MTSSGEGAREAQETQQWDEDGVAAFVYFHTGQAHILAYSIQEKELRGNERALSALTLRKSGMGYIEIAQKLGYADHTGALKAVQRALKITLREPANDVRELELNRLDALLMGQWEAALRGVPQAVDRVLHIMDRRAKYLGLDAPAQYEVLLRQEAERVSAQTGMSVETVLAGVQGILRGEG